MNCASCKRKVHKANKWAQCSDCLRFFHASCGTGLTAGSGSSAHFLEWSCPDCVFFKNQENFAEDKPSVCTPERDGRRLICIVCKMMVAPGESAFNCVNCERTFHPRCTSVGEERHLTLVQAGDYNSRPCRDCRKLAIRNSWKYPDIDNTTVPVQPAFVPSFATPVTRREVLPTEPAGQVQHASTQYQNNYKDTPVARKYDGRRQRSRRMGIDLVGEPCVRRTLKLDQDE